MGSKILVVSAIIPPEPSGSGLRALRHARHYDGRKRLGFLVTETQIGPAGEEFEKIRVVRLPRPCNRRGREEVRYGKVQECVREALDLVRCAFAWMRIFFFRTEKDTVLHCFGIDKSAFFCVLLGNLTGRKTVLEYTVLPDRAGRPGFLRLLNPNRAMKHYAVKRATRIAAISPAIADHCRSMGIPDERIRLIPNGTDLERFTPAAAPEKEKLRSDLGYSGDDLLIINVGGFTLRKGIDITLAAFLALQQDFPRLHLLVVGTNNLGVHKESRKAVYEPLVARGLDESRVHCLGRVPDVERIMRAADLMLFPSRREGFPNVVIEAMACGVPVVARLLPGCTDYILEDGKAGVLVDSNDSGHFADVCRALLISAEARSSMGAAARESVNSRFSNGAVYDLYDKLYGFPAGTREFSGAV